jgi:hypothetical protein
MLEQVAMDFHEKRLKNGEFCCQGSRRIASGQGAV